MGLIQDSYISYVNLAHRTDRNDLMIESLKKVDLPINRMSGILPHEWLGDAVKMKAMLKRPQKGAIGCYLSQTSIIKKAKELNKHAWVMEDDLVFCSDFQKRIDYIDRWIHTPQGFYPNFTWRDWDIIWLGATFHVNPPYWHKATLGRDAELTDDPRIIKSYGSFCTYGYIINRSSIEKVLSLLEEVLPQSIGIDHSMILISPKLNTFAFVPGCVKQYDNLSDQIPENKDVTEFSRFEKLNGTIENSKYWWQDKMEDFIPETFNWAEARVK